MNPDATWPNLPGYREFTEADHAAHRTKRGVHYPIDLYPGGDTKKAAKQLLKVARKPHLGQKRAAPRRRKKKERR